MMPKAARRMKRTIPMMAILKMGELKSEEAVFLGAGRFEAEMCFRYLLLLPVLELFCCPVKMEPINR